MPFKDHTRETVAALIQYCIFDNKLDDEKNPVLNAFFTITQDIDLILKDVGKAANKKTFNAYKNTVDNFYESIVEIQDCLKKENSLTDENKKEKERKKAEKAFDKAVLQYKKLKKAKDEVLELEEKYENIQQFDDLTQSYVELFDMAKDYAINNGFKKLKVECQNTNFAAVNFYRKQGMILCKVNEHAYLDSPNEIQLLWYLDL